MTVKSACDSSDDQKNKDVKVSCWNCFLVENEDNEKELSLSEIRQNNRQQFKLYSVLASEIGKPKIVPLKQKISQNIKTAKKIENKIVTDNVKHTVEIRIEPSDSPETVIEDEDDKTTQLIIEQEPVQVDSVDTTVQLHSNEKDSQIYECSEATETNKEKENEENNSERNQNITADEINESISSVSDKTDNSESIGSYIGCSLQNVASSSPNRSTLSLNTKPCIRSPKNVEEEKNYKSSLPALNLTQKRNILKTSKSLYVADISDSEKPVKSLRWSTLDIPRRSKLSGKSLLFILFSQNFELP